MIYLTIVEQLTPEHRGWQVLIWIDEPEFRKECEQRGISSDFAHPAWPYDMKSWEGIVQEAAVDMVHDHLGVTVPATFGLGGTFSEGVTPGPFRNPTAKHPGFELLLLGS